MAVVMLNRKHQTKDNYMEETNVEHRLLQPWNAEQWLSAFGKAESDIHMLHALRKQVYEYTVYTAIEGS